jgi:hypothetical protein
MHLPVNRNSVYHFLLIKSGFSLFNFLPLVVLLPFTFRYFIPSYSLATGLTWLITLILLIFTSNWLAFFLKKLFSVKPVVILIITIAVSFIGWFDYAHERLISQSFGKWLMNTALEPAWILVPGFLVMAAYTLSWLFLYRQRYLEVKMKNERQYHSTGSSRYIAETFGMTGTLVELEIKMILRNNRPRNYLVLSLLFMLYGLMIYPRHPLDTGYFMFLFIGLLLTGIMMLQYGQLIFSWESSYFDRLCTAGFTTHEYFAAKYWLFFLLNTVTFALSLPYAFYDFRILLVNLAAWLFNCGINIFVVLYLGTYNTKRVDMSKGSFFNYEGVTAVHFILMFPIIGLPLLINWAGSLIGGPQAGLLVTGLTGVFGLLFHRQLINMVTRKFLLRKQKILLGFRNG